jgi:hypothetical protein
MRSKPSSDRIDGMIETAATLPPDPIIGLRPKLLAPGEAALAVPLLLALSKPTPTDDFHTYISDWLSIEPVDARRRGIMTLRNVDNVIVALFFFALAVESAMTRLLQVPCLRVAEPTGRHATLGSALRTIVLLGERLGCSEALLQAELAGAAWLENTAGLLQIGGAHGFEPRGDDWVRILLHGGTRC